MRIGLELWRGRSGPDGLAVGGALPRPRENPRCTSTSAATVACGGEGGRRGVMMRSAKKAKGEAYQQVQSLEGEHHEGPSKLVS